MLPQVEWAVKEKGYKVLVMNPNYTSDPKTEEAIPLLDTMTKHACYVWEKYVIPAKFKSIMVIAHSAGGMCLKNIQKQFPKHFYNNVSKIALTDSSVISPKELNTKLQKEFMLSRCVHFVASLQPLGQEDKNN